MSRRHMFLMRGMLAAALLLAVSSSIAFAQDAPPPPGGRGGQAQPPAGRGAGAPAGRGGQAGGRGQARPAAAPIRRLPDGKPDLSGFYNADAGGANYGLEQHERSGLVPGGRGVIVDPPDGKLPMQDWARKELVSRNLPERGIDDPTAHCFLASVPRSIYVPSPFQILQPPGYLVLLFERMSWRQIPIDGRSHIPDTIRLWHGDSVGRWEGDTLVVESKNFNGKAWLNEVGEILSHAETVVERFTPVNADTITYRATITDPIVYTRPFTIEMALNRSDDELLEVACHEDNEDFKHMQDVKDAAKAAEKKEN
jgi:hypothetical protein